MIVKQQESTGTYADYDNPLQGIVMYRKGMRFLPLSRPKLRAGCAAMRYARRSLVSGDNFVK